MLNTTTYQNHNYTQTEIDQINEIIVKAWAVKPYDTVVSEIAWAEHLLGEGVPALEVAIEMACVFGYMMDFDRLSDKLDALNA
jgi:hypothetical protein